MSSTGPPGGWATVLLALPAAIEFLTPVRVRRGGPLPESAIGRSSAFFPLVGLLLGLMLLGIDRLCSLVLPATAVNGLLVLALALATGALHLDGLADTSDGVFGGGSPERRLEIMRDSRIGSFGAISLVLVLLLQWIALTNLTQPWRHAGLLLFPVLGRTAMVAALAAFPYARPEGLGQSFRRYIWPWPAPVAGVISLLIAVACFGGSGVALLGGSLLSSVLVGLLASSRLGGLTGDVYGAICELSQVVTLLMIVSAHASGWLVAWLIR